jgi:hypothetical protein
MTVQTDIQMPVQVEGAFVPRLPAICRADGTWEPGEGCHIDNLRVVLLLGGRRVDITAGLTPEQLRELEEEAIELHSLNED